MKINLKEKISKVKQIKSPEPAMENPEQTMDVPDDVMIECDSLVKIYKTKDIEVLSTGWGGKIRTYEMPESKSGALPLGYTPI